jgi:histidinol dehydrogenase
MKVISTNSLEWQRLCARQTTRRRRLEDAVRKIVDDVHARGDDALLRYTRRFDGVRLSPRQLRVTEAEVSGAFQHLDPKFALQLKVAIQNVHAFYSRPRLKPVRMVDGDGVVLSEKFDPLERVGVYIPGGTASLVSTVYMTVVPAQRAGVKRIILCTPPRKDGTVDPHILAVASLLDVDEVYRMGGAQAIAAMAFGTKSIPKVDKIVGPGNAYVAEAKRQVYGFVDVDTIAGPSEIAVIANQTANPAYVVADLLGESEHAGGLAFLITPSKALAKACRKQVPGGYCVLVKSLKEAVAVANQLAPEHLEIMVREPRKLARQITAAGAIFLGPYSPVTVGDYVAGPSHVLPTGGSARAFSGLGIDDFVRRTHVVAYTRKALERLREPLERIAAIEGLPRHFDAVKARLS